MKQAIRKFGKSALYSGLATILTVGAAYAQEKMTYPASLYAVGSQKQLFIDDALFETSKGITIVSTPARKTDEVGDRDVRREAVRVSIRRGLCE